MADVLGPIGALADHATRYAAAGFEIFPVKAGTKTPRRSQYDATTDIETVARWWAEHPDDLIGHRISAGVVLTDIDPRHGGVEVWRSLRDHYGERPDTRRHFSGRGDGGGHLWWRVDLADDEQFNVAALDAWARERQLGHAIANSGRWSGGIDVLHRHHRYTILPPSPHPDTGRPYRWHTTETEDILELPQWLRDLIVVTKAAKSAPTSGDGDSVIAWFNTHRTIREALRRHGWTLVKGDGDEDGSLWRHPQATAEHSASVRDGALYVHSPNTPFEPTAPGDPHGYDAFDCFAVLEHRGDRSTAARAAAELRDGPRTTFDPVAWIAAHEPTTEEGPQPDPDLDEFLTTTDPPYDWIIPGYLERTDRLIVTGEEGHGKSTLLRQIALRAASGQLPFGDGTCDPARVWFCDLENPERLARRKWAELRAAGTSYVAGNLRVVHRPEGLNLLARSDVEWFFERVAANRPDLVVTGPLYKLADGDPVKEETARAVARCFDQLRSTFGVALLLEAHVPYADGPRSRRPIRPYGASLWSRWPELGLFLAKDGKLERWRPERDARDWPQALERSEPWPWAVAETMETQEWHGPTQCVEAVVALLAEHPGIELSARRVHDMLRSAADGVGGRRSFREETVRQALEIAHKSNRLHRRFGPRNSLQYQIREAESDRNDLF